MELELSNKATDYEKQLFSQYRQTCATCGKQFIRMPEHQYKVRDPSSTSNSRLLWFCKYSCQVKWMKAHGRW